MQNPFQSVDIRDELLFLKEMSEETISAEIRSCSNEMIGHIVFLIDVVRVRDSAIPIAIFDNSKKYNLDYLVVTVEEISYSDPGVVRIYDVSCKVKVNHTGVDFTIRKWSTLGDLKYVKSSKTTLEELCEMEVSLGSNRIPFYNRTIQDQILTVYILNKLHELYIKSSIQLKNIDISAVTEQAALDNDDAKCLLFNFSSDQIKRKQSMQSDVAANKYSEEKAKQDDQLKGIVEDVQERLGKCSLEDVDNEIVKSISKSENTIMDQLLQIEVKECKEMTDLTGVIGEVASQVSSLEDWLYKHSSRLGVMTKALQSISEENDHLTQQQKNHEKLQDTLSTLLEKITLEDSDLAVISSAEMLMNSYIKECKNWGKTGMEMGIEKGLKRLPPTNAICVVLQCARKLKDVSIANTISLCGVPVCTMEAVNKQCMENSRLAQSFFASVIQIILSSFDKEMTENKNCSIRETCEQILFLAPMFSIVKEYNTGLYTQIKNKLVSMLSKIFAQQLQDQMNLIKSRIIKLPAADSGKLESLPIASLTQCEEEMRSVKNQWEKSYDDMNQYDVTVGLEKLLAWIIPISEVIELVCLEFFSEGDYKKTLENKSIDAFMSQIMVGVSEAIKKMMDNENKSSYSIITQMDLLSYCVSQQSLFLKKRFLYNILDIAKKETMIAWKVFSSGMLAFIQKYSVDTRYCHIIQPVGILPSLVDRLVEAKECGKVILQRIHRDLAKEGPMKSFLREIHTQVNEGIADEKETAQQSMDLQEGGLGILTLLTKTIQQKLDSIANKVPKYTELVYMENYYFMMVSLRARNVPQLASFLKECEEKYTSALSAYCLIQIRYQYNKFVEFVISTRQVVSTMRIEELKFAVNKSTFAKSASLGNVKRPLTKIRARVMKHICGESHLLETVWQAIDTSFIGMITEVEEWARDGYEGMPINPGSEEVHYEINMLKK